MYKIRMNMDKTKLKYKDQVLDIFCNKLTKITANLYVSNNFNNIYNFTILN